jgi:hypothetical protein
MTTTFTATKNARTIVASASNAAGSTTRGTLGLTTALGGILTVKITNGGTGPTVQCVANILIAHNATTPTAGSAGTDWKTIASVGNGTTASTVGEWSFLIDQAVMQLEVEFTGNTGQAVTVEAYFSELTSIVGA